MLKVNEVCRMTGVSARTLHHYDSIGLLKPSCVTESGYRLYDDSDLERLGQIMLFKELDFSLKEIKDILDNPDFDRQKALKQQIELLNLKKTRIENMISFAERISRTGDFKMDFKVFDKEKIEKYSDEAKKKWGSTEAYKEYSEKTADYSEDKQKVLADKLMNIFKEFGAMLDKSPSDNIVQKQVEKLQDFITANYYTCTNQILAGLGQMYNAGGEMTDNIESAGGNGTAEFVSKAISEYCRL